jgi:hypothetical protein
MKIEGENRLTITLRTDIANPFEIRVHIEFFVDAVFSEELDGQEYALIQFHEPPSISNVIEEGIDF